MYNVYAYKYAYIYAYSNMLMNIVYVYENMHKKVKSWVKNRFWRHLVVKWRHLVVKLRHIVYMPPDSEKTNQDLQFEVLHDMVKAILKIDLVNIFNHA